MKQRAPRNRTLTCTPEELAALSPELLQLSEPIDLPAVSDRVIQGDTRALLSLLPRAMADLVILDPPYNLTKNYGGHLFRSRATAEYQAWFAEILTGLLPLLKPGATVYVCSDWRTSNLIFPLLDEQLQVRNRITWEREKGRGARRNWKNSSEDIWFCTVDDGYFFDVEAVKLKRRVQAPYRQTDGAPKDWQATAQGDFRLTHPANLWSDITVPFWSMPENTDHPTQKPEKLIAKLILASSRPGDTVFDPFLGSGTSAVVARKLGRHFCGIELNQEYGCWALKRLARAATDPTIQGFADGVFWERNSGPGKGHK